MVQMLVPVPQARQNYGTPGYLADPQRQMQGTGPYMIQGTGNSQFDQGRTQPDCERSHDTSQQEPGTQTPHKSQSGGKGEGERKEGGKAAGQQERKEERKGPNNRKLSLLTMNFVDIEFYQEMPDLFPPKLRDIAIRDADASSVTYAELKIPKSHSFEEFSLNEDRDHRKLGHFLLMVPKDAKTAKELKITAWTLFKDDFLAQNQKQIFEEGQGACTALNQGSTIELVRGQCRMLIILQVLGTTDIVKGYCVEPLKLQDSTKVELELMDCRHNRRDQPEKLDAALHHGMTSQDFIEKLYKEENLQIRGKGRDFRELATEISWFRQKWMPGSDQKGHDRAGSLIKGDAGTPAPGDLYEIRVPELGLAIEKKRERLHGQLLQLLPSTKDHPFDHPHIAMVAPLDIEQRSVYLVPRLQLQPVDCPPELLEGKKRYRVVVPRAEGEQGTPRLCQNPKFGKGECMVSFEDGSIKPFDPKDVKYRFPKGKSPIVLLDAWEIFTAISENVSEATWAASSTQAYQAEAARDEQTPEDDIAPEIGESD